MGDGGENPSAPRPRADEAFREGGVWLGPSLVLELVLELVLKIPLKTQGKAFPPLAMCSAGRWFGREGHFFLFKCCDAEASMNCLGGGEHSLMLQRLLASFSCRPNASASTRVFQLPTKCFSV